MNEKQLNKKLEEIAQKTMNITLERRWSDGLDFLANDDSDVAVWSIKEALIEAYKLGLKEASKTKNN